MTENDRDRDFATAYLDEVAGIQQNSRAQVMAEALAVRLRDAMTRNIDMTFEIRKVLIAIMVHAVAEEDRCGQAGAYRELIQKEVADRVWVLLPKLTVNAEGTVKS